MHVVNFSYGATTIITISSLLHDDFLWKTDLGSQLANKPIASANTMRVISKLNYNYFLLLLLYLDEANSNIKKIHAGILVGLFSMAAAFVFTLNSVGIAYLDPFKIIGITTGVIGGTFILAVFLACSNKWVCNDETNDKRRT